MRCPLCGHLARLLTKDYRINTSHEIEVRSHTTQGLRNIVWTSRTLRFSELRTLNETIDNVSARIRTAMTSELANAGTQSDFETMAGMYMADAQRALETAQTELDYRRHEVEEAQSRFKPGDRRVG